MKYATFYNYTNEPFTGYWNGKAYTFKPGQKKEHLNEGIASHFAKHLANEVLTKSGKETYTSPKKPQDVPVFMEVFNKAFIPEGSGEELDPETGLASDEQKINQPSMDINVIPRKVIDPYDAKSQPAVGPGSKPQVIGEIDDLPESESDDEYNNPEESKSE
jgi:hypothetical protein